MDLTTPPSTTKAPYPLVNIRKYSPKNRPTTTKRSRTKPTRKPFDINKPQGDQPRPELSSFLPPGYKLNASDDRSSKLLEEILNRTKPKNTGGKDKIKEKKEDDEEKLVDKDKNKENGTGEYKKSSDQFIIYHKRFRLFSFTILYVSFRKYNRE